MFSLPEIGERLRTQDNRITARHPRTGLLSCECPDPATTRLLMERRDTARRFAEIASEVSNSYDKSDGFPSHHAIGAETAAVTIRREFGLDAPKSAVGSPPRPRKHQPFEYDTEETLP